MVACRAGVLVNPSENLHNASIGTLPLQPIKRDDQHANSPLSCAERAMLAGERRMGQKRMRPQTCQAVSTNGAQFVTAAKTDSQRRPHQSNQLRFADRETTMRLPSRGNSCAARAIHRSSTFRN
jgi:hypothetical protein